jgi:hypothetical protein
MPGVRLPKREGVLAIGADPSVVLAAAPAIGDEVTLDGAIG